MTSKLPNAYDSQSLAWKASFHDLAQKSKKFLEEQEKKK